MIYLQLRKGYDNDIDIADIWKAGGVMLIIVLVIYAIIFGVSAIIAGCDNNINKKYNADADTFNALPLEVRSVLCEYTDDYPDANPETYLIAKREIVLFLEQVKCVTPRVWIIAAAIAVLAISLFMAEEYREQKRRQFYFAEFPLRGPLDFITLCAMFAALPFFLVSLVLLLIHKFDLIDKEKQEIERQAKLAARKSETWQMLPPQVAHCKPADAYRYCETRTSRAREFQLQAIERAQKQVQDTEYELNTLGEHIRNKQRQLNEARAKLHEEQSSSAGLVTKEQAQEELRLIREMRGVSSVSLRKALLQQNAVISFDVKVRVPYRDELYDFGDYRITIFMQKFKCKQIRSGVRKDAMSNAPDYSTNDGFCFGNRRSTIEEYVRAGRIVEAATLIVDSLHSVNDEYAESHIPHCFRKVRVIQERAAFLRRQNQKAR